MRSCPLQAAFSRDAAFDELRRPSPPSALGLTSHDLTEAIARGDLDSVEPDDLPRALEAAWDVQIEAYYQELQAAWPLGSVPSPQRWAGYGPTRRRLLRRLVAQAQARETREVASATGRVVVEQMLEPPEIPLHGRVDRVEHENGNARIVDLKSGWARPQELRPSHRRQLLLYAYLWHALHGEWPAEAAIQRLDGSRMTIDVEPAEAEALAEELLEQREAFNAALATTGSVWRLASPSAESCQYCDFKTVCPAFFEEATESWGCYRRHLLGRITAVAEAGVATRLDIEVDAGNLPGGTGTARVIGVPGDAAPDLGARVAVVDALPTPVPGELRIAWDSLLYVWP